MSRRVARGGGGRESEARATRAAVLVVCPRCQPCAARARAQAPSSQRGVVPASRMPSASPQAAALRWTHSPASQTLPANHGRQPSKRAPDLFPNYGGLTMAKTAPSFFYDPLKFVPLGGFAQPGTGRSESGGK